MVVGTKSDLQDEIKVTPGIEEEREERGEGGEGWWCVYVWVQT